MKMKPDQKHLQDLLDQINRLERQLSVVCEHLDRIQARRGTVGTGTVEAGLNYLSKEVGRVGAQVKALPKT